MTCMKNVYNLLKTSWKLLDGGDISDDSFSISTELDFLIMSILDLPYDLTWWMNVNGYYGIVSIVCFISAMISSVSAVH